MTSWRIAMCASVIASLACLASPRQAKAQSPSGDDFRVTLLGTGSPQPAIDEWHLLWHRRHRGRAQAVDSKGGG